jgi:hypothetical protein
MASRWATPVYSPNAGGRSEWWTTPESNKVHCESSRSTTVATSCVAHVLQPLGHRQTCYAHVELHGGRDAE